jgi:hypothetical protein
MSDKEEIKVEVPKVDSQRPAIKPPVEMIHRDNYFNTYHPDFDVVLRAYISETSHATIKSKEEWDALVEKHVPEIVNTKKVEE